MNKAKIQSITVVTQQGCKTYEVDEWSPDYPKGCQGSVVGEVRDISREYESHMQLLYQVYDKYGKLIASIDNCPVNVVYCNG